MPNEITPENPLSSDEVSPSEDRPAVASGDPCCHCFCCYWGNYSVGGGFGVGMVSLFYSHQPQTSVPPVSDSKGGQQSLQQGCAPARIPLNVVVQHAAYEVHMTVDQVKSQVHAGKTFAQIAIARHITVQQLHVFVIYAQQQANDYWPGLGCITWQDETSNMQRDQGEAAPKGSEFTGVFK